MINSSLQTRIGLVRIPPPPPSQHVLLKLLSLQAGKYLWSRLCRQYLTVVGREVARHCLTVCFCSHLLLIYIPFTLCIYSVLNKLNYGCLEADHSLLHIASNHVTVHLSQWSRGYALEAVHFLPRLRLLLKSWACLLSRNQTWINPDEENTLPRINSLT